MSDENSIRKSSGVIYDDGSPKNCNREEKSKTGMCQNVSCSIVSDDDIAFI